MAIHGPKREIVSLLSFIRTGELGPLKLGMKMRQVSELLGPPDWWMDGHDADISPVPLLWGYNRMLEVFFSYEAPHVVETIKLRQLPSLGQRHLRVRWRLWIRADGIHDEMKISDFVRLPIWNECRRVTVGLSNRENIDILTDAVELLFYMRNREEEELKEAQDDLETAAYVALRDRLSTGLHGIYSTARPKDNRYFQDDWRDFSVPDYLALVDAGK